MVDLWNNIEMQIIFSITKIGFHPVYLPCFHFFKFVGQSDSSLANLSA